MIVILTTILLFIVSIAEAHWRPLYELDALEKKIIREHTKMRAPLKQILKHATHFLILAPNTVMVRFTNGDMAVYGSRNTPVSIRSEGSPENQRYDAYPSDPGNNPKANEASNLLSDSLDKIFYPWYIHEGELNPSWTPEERQRAQELLDEWIDSFIENFSTDEKYRDGMSLLMLARRFGNKSIPLLNYRDWYTDNTLASFYEGYILSDKTMSPEDNPSEEQTREAIYALKDLLMSPHQSTDSFKIFLETALRIKNLEPEVYDILASQGKIIY